MSRILLDTSAYSAMLRSHEGVAEAVRSAHEVAINPVILGELLVGFYRGRRKDSNLELLGRFLRSPRLRIYPVDEETADRYAVILGALRKAGTPISTNELWIAASAMQYGLRLVTLDTDFQRVQQIIVDHFEP